MPCVPEVSLETNKEEPVAKGGRGPDQPETAWSAIKGQKGKKRKKILNISCTGEWTSNATVFHPSRRIIASCATQGLEKQLLPCIGSGSVNDGSFFGKQSGSSCWDWKIYVSSDKAAPFGGVCLLDVKAALLKYAVNVGKVCQFQDSFFYSGPNLETVNKLQDIILRMYYIIK